MEFSDLRKFAKIVLLDTKQIVEYKDIKTLGVDAMSPEFTFQKFEEILSKKQKAPIGIILMDQNLISGIGNIYRSEILFEAGIMPEKLAKDLSDKERKEIYKQIGVVLKKAIKLRGTSDSDYRDTDGAPGGFQKMLKVYNREKQTCQKCGTIIVRKKMGGRSVFFCSKCQK
jgi:formamidopyrimidine-DNA glycosylase